MPGRCDRCCQDAQAEWWHAETKATLELCGHHDRKHGPSLLAQGWVSKHARPTLPPVNAEGATH